MASMKILQFSRAPPPGQLCSKFFQRLDLGRTISNESLPPFQMIANQLKENKRKHNPRMAIISYQALPSGWLSFSASNH